MFLINEDASVLWQDTVKTAEQRCSVALKDDLESYLVALLIHYTREPAIVHRLFASAFLTAKQSNDAHSLQQVGDQCLIYAGLFPHAVERKMVKISYFVNLGQSAYIAVSRKTNDIFSSLSIQFVTLMDILQSIRPNPDLLPMEAYDQWSEVGSLRAFRILKEYTSYRGLPK